MTEFMKTYKLKITVLSPVHIGASKDLEPTEYVICGNCLYTFTPEQLSEALGEYEKDELLEIVQRNDPYTLKDLQMFFRDNARTIAAEGTKRARVSPSLADAYRKMETNRRFYIEQQISDPVTGSPYIPGSSIKGAIRTALMSKKKENYPLDRGEFIDWKDGRKIIKKDAGIRAERKLYGYDTASAQDAPDPFKALKLCDAVACSSDLLTKICPAQRTGKKGNIPSNIEVIPENAFFISSLSIMRDVKPVDFGETIETIREACNDFYLDVLEKEIQRKWGTGLLPLINCVKSKAAAGNAFILSLGKHGGAESKTIKGLRIIENRQKNKLMDHSETYFRLIDEDAGGKFKPLGWCVVEFEEVK